MVGNWLDVAVHIFLLTLDFRFRLSLTVMFSDVSKAEEVMVVVLLLQV